MSKLQDEKSMVLLSTCVDEELIKLYKEKKLIKTGRPIEFKHDNDKWKLQCIQIQHKFCNVVTFIAIRVFITESKELSGGAGTYRTRMVKKEHNYPIKDIYCTPGDNRDTIIATAIEQLGYVECSCCKKQIFGNEPRMEDKKWWCKNCHIMHFPG